MRGLPRGIVAALFLALPLAGCVSDADSGGARSTSLVSIKAEARFSQPAAGVDFTKLTQPVYGMLPKVPAYLTAALDSIKLYSESFLPNGPGPWPTILINSPYYDHGINGVTDVESAFRTYFVPRGYAVVVADVRGTGNSEGCMDMMGLKEQRDTYDLVEWIANQTWSDGKVGMYGVSYVGTTPGEAAIMAPPHLVTIVPVAGVTNQWRNMYMNGVPYSGRFYPLTYEVLEGAPPPGDVARGPDWAKNAAAGGCDQEEALRHVSPGVYEKGVYDKYWADRNFTTRVKNIRASVFYNEGFTDRAVNPMEALYWFNEMDVPKKAFLGQWAHRTPFRNDWQNTLNAWFDYWLKGIENGIMTTPTVEVVTNLNTIRTDTEWPPTSAVSTRFFLSAGRLTAEIPAKGSATYLADMARNPVTAVFYPPVAEPLPTQIEFTTEALASDLYMSGNAWMHLRASVNADNTYFLCSLYDVDGPTWREVDEGWMNAHLWESFDKSSPLAPGREYSFHFKFEPRDYIFQKGHKVGLRILGHDGRVFPVDELVTQNTVYFGGEFASNLELPLLDNPVTYERPTTI